MRLMITFAALFLSVILLQLSSGGVGPLDALSGLHLGFSTPQIGLLGSSHFVGFFIGCWWAPRLMCAVGASRTFAAFTAMGAIGLLMHMLIIDPVAWAVMRVASGACIAGSYTVVEAWLHAKTENQSRGRTMGVYRLADLGGALAAQLMIGILEPAHYVSYNLLALICCAAILPLTLTRLKPPKIHGIPRMNPRLAWRLSPLAAVAVMVAALSGASFRMVGPIYAQNVGLEAQQIALYLAAFVLGGAAAQYPFGWLADRYDRRWVLIWLSVLAVLSCLLTALLPLGAAQQTFALAAFFGLTTVPIYSVATAHAQDFAKPEERVELSAAHLFYFALGAITAPYLTSGLMSGYGPAAMYYLIATGHVGLIIFGLVRSRVRPVAATRTTYVYAPRTSPLIGRLLRRVRDPDS